MAVGPVQGNSGGPNLQAIGLKGPQEVIDILAQVSISDEKGNKMLVINDDSLVNNPTAKAQQVINFFKENFGVQPNELPHLASVIKHEVRTGNIKWEA